MKEVKTLKVHLKGEGETGRVWLNGGELKPERSREYRDHSNEFSWGYGGSGPAQLALAIMLEVNDMSAGYQDFKWLVIAQLPQGKDFDQWIEVPR